MIINALPALNSIVHLTVYFTRNGSVGPTSAERLGASLGYGAELLAGGWAVTVLTEPLTTDDFELHANTMRSGGREGLPSDSPERDRLRRLEHERIMSEYGPEGYRRLQKVALSAMTLSGSDRVVKVITAAKPGENESPAKNYPMGGGGSQWRLIRPKKFKVAMTVDHTGMARIPGFTVSLIGNVPIDSREKLARHIAAA